MDSHRHPAPSTRADRRCRLPGAQVIEREALGAGLFGDKALVIVAHALAIDRIDCVVPLRQPGQQFQHAGQQGFEQQLATVALRNTPLTMAMLEKHPNRENAIVLLAEGFDMLEEDLDKERFFAFTRRSYWESAATSPRRVLMQTLIGKLDF